MGASLLALAKSIYYDIGQCRGSEMGLLLRWRNLVGASLVVLSLFAIEQY